MITDPPPTSFTTSLCFARATSSTGGPSPPIGKVAKPSRDKGDGELGGGARDGHKVLGGVGGERDANAPAAAKAGPKHSEKQDSLRYDKKLIQSTHSEKVWPIKLGWLGRAQLMVRRLGIGRSDGHMWPAGMRRQLEA